MPSQVTLETALNKLEMTSPSPVVLHLNLLLNILQPGYDFLWRNFLCTRQVIPAETVICIYVP